MNPLVNNKITTELNDSAGRLQPGQITEELLSQFSEPIISVKTSGEILFWNSGAERHFGCSSDMALGKRLWNFGITALGEHEWQQLFQQTLSNTTTTKHLRFKHQNGSSFTGNICLKTIKDENGHPHFISAIIKDIASASAIGDLLQNNIAVTANEVKREHDIYNSDNPYLKLLENSFDVITLIDKSFNVIYRSPSSERIVGWTDQDIIGMNGMQNVHPGDVERATQIVKFATQNPGVPTDCSVRLKHKNGKYVNLEGKLINLLDVQEIGAYVFNFHDVTERVKADEFVRKSEEKYRHLVERITEGFTALDKEWRFTYVNAQAARAIGRRPEDLQGKVIWEEYPRLIGTNTYIALTTAMETQQYYYNIDYDKERDWWFENHVYPSQNGVSAIIKNITAKTKAEISARNFQETKDQILRSALDAIVGIDMNGKITIWNQQAEKLFGWNLKDIIGKSIVDTIIPKQLENNHLDQFQHRDGVVNNTMLNKLFEISARRADGSEFPIELFMVTLKDNTEDIYCAFIRDITDRKLAQQEIEQSRFHLNQAQSVAPVGSWQKDFRTGKG